MCSAVARSWRGYVLGLLSVAAVTILIGALEPPWHVAKL